MSIASINKFNNIYYLGKVTWIVLGAIYLIVSVITIIDEKWIYIGVLLLPLLMYSSIKNPFIFPFGVYVFFLPFDSISSITGDIKVVTLTRILGALTIVVFVLKGIVENKLRKPQSATLWWVIFIIYGLLSVTWAISPEAVLKQAPTAIGLLMLYLITTSYEVVEEDYETFKMCILLGGVLTVAILMYGFLTGDFQRRATLSIGSVSANPNGLAFSLLLPLSISIEKILRNTGLKKKIIFVALLVLIVLCIILTGSRANMFAGGLIIILYLYYSKQKALLSTILILGGIILIQFIPNIFYERWSQAIDTGGSGRLDIWYVGWKSLSRYWLVGAGLSNFPLAYNEFVDYSPVFRNFDRASHNIYLKSIVEMGIVGFSLLVFVIWKHYSLLKSRFMQGDINQIMLKSAFGAILFSSFFNGRMWNKEFWLIWMMIIMYCNMIDRDKLFRKSSFK